MPALILLLVVLLIYGMVVGEFMEGFEFLFTPDFSQLSGDSVLLALGQAFFTLSVGMGAIMAYGAYLPGDESIVRTSIAVVVADTGIAILAALVIFSITFQFGVDETSGPGLVFVSLPLAFGQMTGGIFVAVSFFALLTFAAWTSAISLMEPAVTYFIEQLNFSRVTAALTVGVIIWGLGLLTVLSFGPWADLTLLDRTVFGWLDFATNNVLLPLGGFAIIVFAGWFMAKNSTADEIDPQAGLTYRLGRASARYVVPIAIFVVLLNATGLLERIRSYLPG
jgi:NSS family neurotransmitter:Na+ symporter